MASLGEMHRRAPCRVILDLAAGLLPVCRPSEGTCGSRLVLNSPVPSAMTPICRCWFYIERFCLQRALAGLVPDVSGCPAGPHRGPGPRGEQGGPGGRWAARWRGSPTAAAGGGQMLCCCLVPQPSSVEAAASVRSPVACGLPPEAEGEVEAEIPGACWVVLGVVPGLRGA
uniref:Melanocortin-2 receptor accessory protein isoform X1 n=1 Tax=Sus scrofa TaxID=9823 RepID=A0A480J228_PIG